MTGNKNINESSGLKCPIHGLLLNDDDQTCPEIGCIYSRSLQEAIEPGSDQDFQLKFKKFMTTAWQEDTEISLVDLISEYQNQIIKNPSAGKDYLKRFIDANKRAIALSTSDNFQYALDELAGIDPSEQAAPVQPSLQNESKKSNKNMIMEQDLTKGTPVFLKGKRTGTYVGKTSHDKNAKHLIKLDSGEHKELRRGVDFWTRQDIDDLKAQKQAEKAGRPKKAPNHSQKIYNLKVQLSELEDELDEVNKEQDIEAGYFQQDYGNSWYHEWEAQGKHNEYGEKMNAIESKIEKIKRLIVKFGGGNSEKELTSAEAEAMVESVKFKENYLYAPTKDFCYLVQVDNSFNPYSAGTYQKMYFSNESTAKNFIENNKPGDFNYKGKVSVNSSDSDNYEWNSQSGNE